MKPMAYTLMKDWEDTYWWYRARREIICQTVARHVPRGAAILDYGSGTGATAIALRQAGYSITVADVSDHSLDACRAANLRTIDLRTEKILDQSTDCVLAADVLEHVEDDLQLLKNLRRALKPAACLIATVPACDFLWSGEDHVSNHFRRYTKSRLLSQLEQADFTPIWCSYFNTFLSPMVAATILVKRLFRPKDMYRSNLHPLPQVLNNVLYRIFAMEKTALKHIRFPFGTSILAVAQCAASNLRRQD